MSKKKDNPGRFVLRSECTQMMGEHNRMMGEQGKKLDTMMNALVGEDLQGGLVKAVTAIQGELKSKATKEDVQQIQEKRKWSKREIAVVLVAVITVIGNVFVALINLFKP